MARWRPRSWWQPRKPLEAATGCSTQTGPTRRRIFLLSHATIKIIEICKNVCHLWLQDMQLVRIFKTRTEEEMEHDEHNYTAEMQCNLECESTKILLCLGLNP